MSSIISESSVKQDKKAKVSEKAFSKKKKAKPSPKKQVPTTERKKMRSEISREKKMDMMEEVMDEAPMEGMGDISGEEVERVVTSVERKQLFIIINK
jgi:hypothetical protein